MGSVTLGANGELRAISLEFSQVVGTSTDALSGALLVDLVHPDDAIAVWSILARPLEWEAQIRVRLGRDDGSSANVQTWSEVDLRLARTADGGTSVEFARTDAAVGTASLIPTPADSRRSPRLLFWSAAGFGAQSVAQLVLLVALARLISPSEFGLVGAALVVVGAGRLVLTAVAGPALIQHPKVSPEHFGAGWLLAVVGSALAGLGCLVTAPWIANFFDEPALAPALRWMSIAFVFQAVTIVPEARLIRRMDLRHIAFADAGSWLGGYLISGLIAGVMLQDHVAIVIAVIAQFIVRAGLLAPAIERPKRPRWRHFREIASFSGGFFLGRVGNYGAGQADNILVGRVLGLDALGIYGRAYQIATMAPLLIGQVVDRVMFPTLARLVDRPGYFQRSFQAALTFMAVTSGAASALLSVTAPELVQLALGDEWVGVVRPLQVLAAFIMIRTCYKLFDSMARAAGAVYQRAWRQWVFAGSVIFAAWLGTQHSLAWVAFGVSVSVVLNFLLMAQLGLRHAPLTIRPIVLPLLLGLAPGLGALAAGVLAKQAASSLGTTATLLISVVACGLGAIVGIGLIWPNAKTQLDDWNESVVVARSGNNDG